MRTLFEILEAARHGQKPTHDECYYVMLMQSALHALDRQAIRSLLNERLKIDPKLRAMVELVNNNIFDRNKKALDSDPQEWLGDNVPGNPGYDRFLRMSEQVVDQLLKKGDKSVQMLPADPGISLMKIGSRWLFW